MRFHIALLVLSLYVTAVLSEHKRGKAQKYQAQSTQGSMAELSKDDRDSSRGAAERRRSVNDEDDVCTTTPKPSFKGRDQRSMKTRTDEEESSREAPYAFYSNVKENTGDQSVTRPPDDALAQMKKKKKAGSDAGPSIIISNLVNSHSKSEPEDLKSNTDSLGGPSNEELLKKHETSENPSVTRHPDRENAEIRENSRDLSKDFPSLFSNVRRGKSKDRRIRYYSNSQQTDWNPSNWNTPVTEIPPSGGDGQDTTSKKSLPKIEVVCMAKVATTSTR